MSRKHHYHIIGDIHGQAKKLEGLLRQLGYRKNGNGYRHPVASTIFLGDFIDRGRENGRVLEIVQDMVASGQARAIMGNHEFNAVCYHTMSGDEPLRCRDDTTTRQHATFLDEFGFDTAATRKAISWFRSLPLFIEQEGFRAIHACWHQKELDSLPLNPDNTLPARLYTESCSKANGTSLAIKTVLKGTTVPLPAGTAFKDKDGYKRRKIRTRWWLDGQQTYRDLMMTQDPIPETVREQQLRVAACYRATDPPVFIGHYWLTGKPALQQHNICCLDYSAGKDGPLIAYRHTVGEPFSNARFIVGTTNS